MSTHNTTARRLNDELERVRKAVEHAKKLVNGANDDVENMTTLAKRVLAAQQKKNASVHGKSSGYAPLNRSKFGGSRSRKRKGTRRKGKGRKGTRRR